MPYKNVPVNASIKSKQYKSKKHRGGGIKSK
jgi:hypothetical protein